MDLEQFQAVSLNDHGGGDLNWWQDYIRSLLNSAHDFYHDQVRDVVPAHRLNEREHKLLSALVKSHIGELKEMRQECVAHDEIEGVRRISDSISVSENLLEKLK